METSNQKRTCYNDRTYLWPFQCSPFKGSEQSNIKAYEETLINTQMEKGLSLLSSIDQHAQPFIWFYILPLCNPFPSINLSVNTEYLLCDGGEGQGEMTRAFWHKKQNKRNCFFLITSSQGPKTVFINCIVLATSLKNSIHALQSV